MGKFVKKLMLGMIRWYQTCISPMHPGCCRYTPTCSAYMMQAIEKHGPFRGLMLGLWRILRCNPFSKGGYDPVPEPKASRHRQDN